MKIIPLASTVSIVTFGALTALCIIKGLYEGALGLTILLFFLSIFCVDSNI